MNIKVKIQNQTFEVNVGDLNTRPIIATVDGQTFEVWPEDLSPASATPKYIQATPGVAPVVVPTGSLASAVKTPAAPAVVSSAGAIPAGGIVAPIPGVIVGIVVKEGDAVKKGQELVILEAMKMKNSIRSSGDGIISEIKVKIGDHVQNGQTLITFKN